jgi:hypothetical protein
MLSQKSLRSGRQTSTTAASDTAWLAAVKPPMIRPAIRSAIEPQAKAAEITT